MGFSALSKTKESETVTVQETLRAQDRYNVVFRVDKNKKTILKYRARCWEYSVMAEHTQGSSIPAAHK